MGSLCDPLDASLSLYLSLIPSICPVPKHLGNHQHGRPESVSSAPLPYLGPSCLTPPAKGRDFLREQTSNMQAHKQSLARTHAK